MLILKLLTVYHLRSQNYCDVVCGHKIDRGDFFFCLDSCSTGAVKSKGNREIPVSAVTKWMGRDCYWTQACFCHPALPTSPLCAQVPLLDGFLWKALAFGKLFCCLNAGGGL